VGMLSKLPRSTDGLEIIAAVGWTYL